MIALLRKEITGALPVWIGAAALCLTWILAAAFDDLGTSDPWRTFDELGDVGLIMLFAFASGHWLAASEARDRSLAFLDGLPVRRPTVFFVKVLAGAAPLALLLACWAAILYGVSALAATPYTADPSGPAAVFALAVVVTALGWYGLGLGLSWLAELGWAALAFLMFVFLVLVLPFPWIDAWIPQENYPSMEAVDGIPSFELQGTRFWAALGGLCAFVSAWKFVRWDTTRALDLGCAVRVLLWIGAGVSLLLLLLLLFLTVVGTKWTRLLTATETVKVGPMTFLYDPAEAQPARAVIGTSRSVDRYVRDVFGVTETLSLDVELTELTPFHLGVFHGGKIRLAPHAGPDVLAHELSHAYSYALAGPSLKEHDASAEFFVEGVAEWAAGRVFPHAAQDATSWRTSAAVWATGQAAFDLLADKEARLRRHDVAQVYPLGHTLVITIAEVEGDDAPPCLLRAMRETAREDLEGLGLWYRLFQVCDADLDGVLAAWRTRLDAEAEKLPPLPDPGARVDATGSRLLVEDRENVGWDLWCRFRALEDEDIGRMRQEAVRNGACAIPLDHTRAGSVDYQLGFSLPDGDFVFEEWTTAALP